MPSLLDGLLVDAVIATISHHIWFRQYEPTSWGLIFMTTSTITLPVVYYTRPFLGSIVAAFLLTNAVYFGALLTSIVAYRLSPFHPLWNVPGPTLCKVSKVWMMWIAYKGGLHRYCKEAHDVYGPVVRIGPNEISIIDKDLFPAILGPNGMPKGPVWDSRRIVTSRDYKNHKSFHAVRNLKVHAEFRKPWNKAFSKGPMKDYQEILLGRATDLVKRLEKRCGEGKEGTIEDMARWLNLFAFDFMGEMVFSETFNVMDKPDVSGAWEIFERGLIFPSIAQHIPWIAPLTHLFPSFAKDSKDFHIFAAAQARARAKFSSESLQRDLFYHLLNFTEHEPDVSPLPFIMSNSVLAIAAGADTAATGLGSAVFYLLANPRWLDKVNEELDTLCGELRLLRGDIPPFEKLASLQVLNAVINESLRLLPPFLTQLQRAPATRSGGKQLGSLFVPEGTAVQVPPYAVHRSSTYFSPSPNEFRPQRWLFEHQEEAFDRGAFIPFSMGPANCVGRQLAMDEMRVVVALLARNFEMEFEEGYDVRRWEWEMADRFLAVKGVLPVRLRRKTE
ncbi:cytochrome P450 67 [Coprinopsis marcescibilis]|uniref:Cytochrome P450 67 n=1 Tax=Coprinopsis marcescibilis TaxID=230819 RepID=A0A5C3KYD6_COPMA|nr:cytochrome P450 67 [Coprinopsis marcescibilis]